MRKHFDCAAWKMAQPQPSFTRLAFAAHSLQHACALVMPWRSPAGPEPPLQSWSVWKEQLAAGTGAGGVGGGVGFGGVGGGGPQVPAPAPGPASGATAASDQEDGMGEE